MSGGGGSTTTQSIPKFLEDAAKENLARARYVSQIGYVPQYGNDVAAFSPMQQSAFNNTSAAANAFGLGAPVDANAYMPKPVTDNLGFTGYGSGAMFDQYMNNLERQREGQFNAINNMFVDPYSGEAGNAPVQFTPMGSIGASALADINSTGLTPQQSSDTADFMRNPSQISGDALLRQKKLADAISKFGLIGAIVGGAMNSNYDKVTGGLNPYSGDMFYDTNMNSYTPVRGADFYDSAEAAANIAKVGPSISSSSDSSSAPAGRSYTSSNWSSSTNAVGAGGGNASRGYSYGGW